MSFLPSVSHKKSWEFHRLKKSLHLPVHKMRQEYKNRLRYHSLASQSLRQSRGKMILSEGMSTHLELSNLVIDLQLQSKDGATELPSINASVLKPGEKILPGKRRFHLRLIVRSQYLALFEEHASMMESSTSALLAHRG